MHFLKPYLAVVADGHNHHVFFEEVFRRVECSSVAIGGVGQGSVAVEHLQLVVDFEVTFAAEGAEYFHCLVTARSQ
jgi:hypothetical protein